MIDCDAAPSADLGFLISPGYLRRWTIAQSVSDTLILPHPRTHSASRYRPATMRVIPNRSGTQPLFTWASGSLESASHDTVVGQRLRWQACPAHLPGGGGAGYGEIAAEGWMLRAED
jgi:hypothetical protein